MKKQTVAKTPTAVNATKGVQFNHTAPTVPSTTTDKSREAITNVCAGLPDPKKPVVLTENTRLGEETRRK